MDKARHDRIRRLVRQLNRKRRLQARKIDILCNDMISVHAGFVERLAHLDFAAECYERMLACTDITAALETAAETITSAVCASGVAVFLLKDNGFDLHVADGDGPINLTPNALESWFTPDMVKQTSAAGKAHKLDNLPARDSTSRPFCDIIAYAVPIRPLGAPLGFILLYGDRPDTITRQDIAKVISITPGLCNLIDAFTSTAPANTSPTSPD